MSKLWVKSNYLNRNIDALFDTNIIEYDLSSANTSLSREYGLLPIETVEELDSLPNQLRKVHFGKLMRKDKSISKKLSRAFEDIRRRFIVENKLEDIDILSIKKDAIFVIDPLYKVKTTNFGHCTFRDKNKYSSYLFLKNIELYINRDRIDVKGINDSYVEKHKEYILDFVKNVVDLKVKASDPSVYYRYISKFVTDYKLGDLDPHYYREFNGNSLFKIVDSDLSFKDLEFISPIYEIDRTYNFDNVILPLVRIMVS